MYLLFSCKSMSSWVPGPTGTLYHFHLISFIITLSVCKASRLCATEQIGAAELVTDCQHTRSHTRSPSLWPWWAGDTRPKAAWSLQGPADRPRGSLEWETARPPTSRHLEKMRFSGYGMVPSSQYRFHLQQWFWTPENIPIFLSFVSC